MKINDVKNIDNGSGFLAFWSRTGETLKHIRTRLPTVVAVGLIIAWVIYLMVMSNGVLSLSFTKFLTIKSWNTILSIATLLAVIAVWLAELKEDWRMSLPKYISAKFYECNGNEIKKLTYNDYAFLVDVGDSRSLAQQLGSQKIVGFHLDFDPTKFRLLKKIKTGKTTEDRKITFMHYEIESTLNTIPKFKSDEKKDNFKKDNFKKEEVYLKDIADNFEELLKAKKIKESDKILNKMKLLFEEYLPKNKKDKQDKEDKNDKN